MRLLLIILSLTLSADCALAQPLDINFGTGFPPLPYTESGITFTSSGIGYIAGGALRAGGSAGSVRAEAAGPFDLNALEIEAIGGSWRIETSASGVFQLPGVGLHNLSGMQGFSGITYFNIITDETFNPLLNVDQIQITYVPEPTAGALFILGGMAVYWRCRRLAYRTR